MSAQQTMPDAGVAELSAAARTLRLRRSQAPAIPTTCRRLRRLRRPAVACEQARCAAHSLSAVTLAVEGEKLVPTISMFYGIIIRMYFAPGEHPPPHFHVYYSEHKATVDIRTCEVIEGNLPPQLSLIMERVAFLIRSRCLTSEYSSGLKIIASSSRFGLRSTR